MSKRICTFQTATAHRPQVHCPDRDATVAARTEQPALSEFQESLMERVVDPANMEAAWKNVKANRGAPGPDGITIAEFPDWLRPRWADDPTTASRWHLSPGTGATKGHRQARWRSAVARHSKRARPPDPASHRSSPDADLRSELLGIELRFSTETFRSRSSQASATHHPSWLSLRG